MRIYRQNRPFRDGSVLMLEAWRKLNYLRGWYVKVQLGKRAWLIMPKDKNAPKRQVKT